MKNALGSTHNLWRHYRKQHETVSITPYLYDFSRNIFIDKLVQWVIEEMLPFTIIEEESLKNLLKYLNPSDETVTGDTIKSKINEKFIEEKQRIFNILSKLKSKPSFTVDVWTSLNTIAYFGATIHYIDDDFQLQHFLIDFVQLKSRRQCIDLVIYISCSNLH
jgi:hypothetical protein